MKKTPWLLAVWLIGSSFWLHGETPFSAQDQNKVRARVQARPGGPVQEVEMAVHQVPVDPPSIPATEATLSDEDLVLGVVLDGKPVAYPIRYLALYEILNDRIGDTPIAPTW